MRLCLIITPCQTDSKLLPCTNCLPCFFASLSRSGAKRATIEAVRVASDLRGKEIGTHLMRHAIAQARAAGCGVVQLTSDKRRARAHLFYRRLGFEQSHIGFKLELGH